MKVLLFLRDYTIHTDLGEIFHSLPQAAEKYRTSSEYPRLLKSVS